MERKPGSAKSRTRLSSVANSLRLMKAFSEDEYEIGISDLAKRLGLAKSTVHRLASTLLEEGILEQNPGDGRAATTNTWKWERESNSRYVYSGSHMWIKNISVGYTFKPATPKLELNVVFRHLHLRDHHPVAILYRDAKLLQPVSIALRIQRRLPVRIDIDTLLRPRHIHLHHNLLAFKEARKHIRVLRRGPTRTDEQSSKTHQQAEAFQFRLRLQRPAGTAHTLLPPESVRGTTKKATKMGREPALS